MPVYAVTGASSQVGRYAVHQLLARSARLHAPDGPRPASNCCYLSIQSLPS
jgi:NAD(P)-dependent dehydrogenase (short-subunit alcohol dehydrogenase family)